MRPRFRYQLPAYSPLSPGALWSGILAAVGVTRESVTESVIAELRDRYGAMDIRLTDAGTSALSLAFRAVQEDRNGAIALPAYSCFDLATAADGADSRVVLYDLDPQTLAPDLDSLVRALKLGATAVVVVHLYGIPVDLSPICSLAVREGAIVIEDAAQGVGARIDGKPAGSLGSLGILSFGRGKGLTAGAGGALLANDGAGHELLARTDSLPNRRGWGGSVVAWAAAQWICSRPGLYRLPASLPFLGLGETRYRSPTPPTEMPAAACGILCRTLSLSAAEVDSRRGTAAQLYRQVEHCRHIRPIRLSPGCESGYLRFPVLLPTVLQGISRFGERARALGVVSGYPASLPRLEGFSARCLNAGEAFPGAEALADRLWTLPTHSRLAARDLQALETWLQSVDGLASS